MPRRDDVTRERRATPQVSPRERFRSGVPGLDEIIGGGLLSAGIYIVAGEPGTGKTVLANQICFARAREGHRCVYLTMLAESHSRMISNMMSLGFFDSALLDERVTYLSGVSALRDGGLEALIELIEEEIHESKPGLLVLDALSIGLEVASDSGLDHAGFLNRLGALLEYSGCTALVITMCRSGTVAMEHAVADGLFELTRKTVGMRSVRAFHACKFRGSNVLDGGHIFEIDEEGVILYPRTEARLARACHVPSRGGERVGFGVTCLDEMLGGGVFGGSTTALIGPTGAGKTLLGLHFLQDGASRGERGLYFGFYESPERVLAQGDAVGLGLSALQQRDLLDVTWQRPFENLLDRLSQDLLAHVRERKIRRVYIDGLEGLAHGAVYPERVPVVLAALTNELRALGVTVLLSVEGKLLGTTVVPEELWSALVENVLVLRYVEVRSQLRRLLWIVKVRGSHFEAALREFTIGKEGIEISEKFTAAEAILTGTPRMDESRGGDAPQGRGQ